jgi:copper homeostasis protein (lipoprotein)
MEWRTPLVLLAMMALGWPAPAGAQVTGTATYLTRMALPSGAVFEASVEDVSRADAPAETIGSVKIPDPGNPPIKFSIAVDPARINQSHVYAVRASVRLNDKVMLRTDSFYPVLTRGHGPVVELTLLGVPATGPAPRPSPAALGQLPASFTGDLPCADCEGIRHRLNLFPDRSFFLSLSYLGKGDGATSDDIGTWMLSSNQTVLVLKGGREAPMLFRIVDSNTLRKLDLEGRDIQSALNYAISRTDTFQRVEPRLAMRGLFRYLADAGSFTECSTGQRWPVAQEAENATLEREYGKVRGTPGGPVMMAIEGRAAMRPRMEGDGSQPVLVVEKLIGTFPGETCAARPVTMPLEGTWWALTRLGDAAVTAKDPRREPGLTFDATARRVSGSGGCNRLTGPYVRSGPDGIALGQIAGTMMACVDGMETESAFLKALPRVRTWNILGGILEFYDEGKTLVARFQAKPAPPGK